MIGRWRGSGLGRHGHPVGCQMDIDTGGVGVGHRQWRRHIVTGRLLGITSGHVQTLLGKKERPPARESDGNEQSPKRGHARRATNDVDASSRDQANEQARRH